MWQKKARQHRARVEQHRAKYRQPKPKSNRAKIIVAICLIIITVAAGIYLWTVHIQRLRASMEDHITETISQIEQGAFRAALMDAEQALSLAGRLRDNDTYSEVEIYVRVAISAVRGDEHFGNGDFQAARDAYIHAADSATESNKLNADLIYERITLTETYIAFYILIEQAESTANASNLEAALALYSEARLVASALSYFDGVNLADSGIQEMQERIIELKRTDAMILFAQGEQLYNDNQYAEALERYYAALAIYVEINDQQNIIITNARINSSESQLGVTGNQERPGSDTQDGSSIQSDPMTNYEHNQGVEFDLTSVIDNQNQSPANQIRMGTREGMNEGWYNGCGWVAAYNALVILETPVHPSEIVRYFESSGGTVLGGVFGTYPSTIEEYIRSQGHRANHTLFPQLSMSLDDAIRNSRVSILAYLHTSAAHYITIEYKEDIGRFVVYNDSFAKARSSRLGYQNETSAGAVIDSVDALISNTPEILLSFSLTTIN